MIEGRGWNTDRWKPRAKVHRLKKCATCKELLAVELFAANPRRRDGLDSQCKPCKAAYDRKRRTKNAPSKEGAPM